MYVVGLTCQIQGDQFGTCESRFQILQKRGMTIKGKKFDPLHLLADLYDADVRFVFIAVEQRIEDMQLANDRCDPSVVLHGLEKERADHKKHFDDLKAAHAKDIAIVNENHARQLMEINMKHKEDITRVKMWCEMNQPRPNELARILERQRRSALQAELRLMKEEAESRDLWDEGRVQELKREKEEVENRLAKLQRQWDDMVAWLSG